MRKPTTVWLQWKASKYPDILLLYDGAVKFAHEPGSFGGSLVPVKVQAKEGKLPGKVWFPPLKRTHSIIYLGNREHRTPMWIVPCWFLTVVYLIPWSAGLIWRCRRHRRVISGTAD